MILGARARGRPAAGGRVEGRFGRSHRPGDAATALRGGRALLARRPPCPTVLRFRGALARAGPMLWTHERPLA
jgi:hypothetical protein